MANAGTVFSIRTDGHVTTIYSFCSQTGCADGQNPLLLALGKDGYFYGTTFSGAGTGFGSIFRITPAGVFTTLYNFCSQPACADGAQPRAGLALAVNTGDFYGTTYLGGANNLGTVFRITPSGPFSLLHSFSGEDGEYPIGGISYRPNGMLYGTTTHGGSSGDGTVFKITLPHKAQ